MDLMNLPTTSPKRPRRAAFYLPKGGIGKTTVGVHVATGLALAGKRVLFLDIDPKQSQAVIYFDGVERRPNVYDLLVDGKPLEECIQQSPNPDFSTLYIVSGTPASTSDIITHFDKMAGKMSWYKEVEKRLRPYESNFDYVLFDCGPATTLFAKAALWYCSELWIPYTIDYMSMDSTDNILGAEIDDIGRNYDFVRYVIPNRLDMGAERKIPLAEEARSRYKWQWLANLLGPKSEGGSAYDAMARVRLNEAMQILGDIMEQFGRQKVTPPIREAKAALIACQGLRKTLWENLPDDPVTDDLARLVQHIIADEEAAVSEQRE